MGLIVKIALGIILAVVVLIAGCSMLLSASIDTREEPATAGITLREFKAVRIGEREPDVRARLGEPASEYVVSGTTCVSYGERGRPVLDGRTFQFCFDGGRLTDKAMS